MAYYVNRNVKLTWWERTYIPEIIRGMVITSRHFFKNLFGFVPFFLGKKKDREIFTVYYPEETMQFPIAYRGRPVLALGENNLPNCVACGLCEIACPAYCIDIIPGENSGKQNEVERYPVKFSIDYAVCIFCGFCEEACPEEAIFMSDQYDITMLDRKKIGVFVLLQAHFLAVLQIIVYAGAIMVLFMFVIMLLNLKDTDKGWKIRERNVWLSSTAGILMLGVLYKFVDVAASSDFNSPATVPENFGTVELVGTSLFTDFVLPFEVASILLLAAMVGAVVLAKSKVD
jgi:NADH:ubiquinone oxidoreductase subunit 6 (subunit J)/Pyruvate/2-oxoacid:ferredoxin oxidoreductase delta subunit